VRPALGVGEGGCWGGAEVGSRGDGDSEGDVIACTHASFACKKWLCKSNREAVGGLWQCVGRWRAWASAGGLVACVGVGRRLAGRWRAWASGGGSAPKLKRGWPRNRTIWPVSRPTSARLLAARPATAPGPFPAKAGAPPKPRPGPPPPRAPAPPKPPPRHSPRPAKAPAPPKPPPRQSRVALRL
jgi:hypothetical protein